VTLTVVDCDTEPPGPVQVSSNSVALDRRPVDHVPLVATTPLQPPVAAHSVALAAVQLRLEVPKLLTVVGDAVKVIEGADRWVTVT
jgi:hypothetical protein